MEEPAPEPPEPWDEGQNEGSQEPTESLHAIPPPPTVSPTLLTSLYKEI